MAVFLAALTFLATSTGRGATSGELRDLRYCEILPAYREGLQIRLDVYVSAGHHDCPQSWWEGLSTDTIAKDLGATGVVLNGPRHWMMDRIVAGGQTVSGTVKTFNGMAMEQRATVYQPISVLLSGGRQPYRPTTVNRTTTFIFKAGRPIHELTDDKGQVYVMQTYSQQVKPDQTMADLPGLAGVLTLPKGWSFSTRTPAEDLNLVADGEAVVIQDNLENSYQLRK